MRVDDGLPVATVGEAKAETTASDPGHETRRGGVASGVCDQSWEHPRHRRSVAGDIPQRTDGSAMPSASRATADTMWAAWRRLMPWRAASLRALTD